MSHTNFIKENNEYLKFILNERFFKPWKEPFTPSQETPYDRSLYTDSTIEIYITAKCNQACEYCYLHKFGKELYPINDNPEIILNNLDILLNYLIENHYCINSIHLFSGEIWHTQFGWDIIQKFYNACQRGLEVNEILIPSNCSFIRDPQAFFMIQNFIDAFASINKILGFSISVDGKIIEEDNRPLNSKETKNDDFYDLLFSFAKHNNFGFHPMCAAYSIEKWIDNYNWYKNQCEKYGINFFKNVMILEVRNDDWTDEKLKYYKAFLEYYFNDFASEFPQTIRKKELMNNIFYSSDRMLLGYSYYPFALVEADTFPSCTVADSLTIRLGDLAICPCHRLARDELLYGHFVVKDNKIIDIEANNIYMPTRILLANNNLCHFKCDACAYNKYCLKGCFGSQYEVNQDPFLPIESVCKLYKIKINTLISLYEKEGLIEELKLCPPTHMYYPQAQSFLQYIEEVKNEKVREFYKEHFTPQQKRN